ncbi:MAG: hypothetical protein ACE5KM_03065 [Planctomycetaceae bacterium]
MSLYRIRRRPAIVAESAETPSELREHLDRALQLIPADVVAAYLTVRGFWLPRDLQTADELAGVVLNWWLPVIGFMATLALRIAGSSKRFARFDDVQWKTVVISGVAFILWVFAIQDSVFGFSLDPRIPPSVLALFTLVVPFIEKGS